MTGKSLWWAYLILFGCGALAQSQSKPLLLEKNEGELRYRRANAGLGTPFMLKVSPRNNGSQRLVLGEEDMAPGALIPKHKHLEQDEILLIQTGTAHVWLGELERDLHAGATVFIPQNTWISVKNTGTESMHLVFVFSAPGFEEYLRCTSFPDASTAKNADAMTDDERRACSHQGHVIYEHLQTGKQ